MSTFDIPWSALIDTAPDGWCVLDAEGRVRYANAAALTLLGLPAPTGVSISEWLSDLNAKNRDLMLGAIQERGQVRLQLPDAQHPYLLFEAGPLPGVAGTLARVRRDHEVEASEIIAITIHELRKPMTSITGYAQMMLGLDTESLSDMQRQFLDTINRNVQRLNSDLFTVQDMTRIDRGKVQLTPTRQSPARIATLVLDELRPLLEKKGHHVTLDFPEDLPPVRADAERFEQVAVGYHADKFAFLHHQEMVELEMLEDLPDSCDSIVHRNLENFPAHNRIDGHLTSPMLVTVTQPIFFYRSSRPKTHDSHTTRRRWRKPKTAPRHCESGIRPGELLV